MRGLVQRVTEASVTTDGMVRGEIGRGLLVLVGISADDTLKDAEWMVKKIIQLRIFPDGEGRMNHSLRDINGAVLVVSQFTLYASVRKGNRPSYIAAAPPQQAEEIYQQVVRLFEAYMPGNVKTGVFGADMKVRLLNDGPVTILVDSRE